MCRTGPGVINWTVMLGPPRGDPRVRLQSIREAKGGRLMTRRRPKLSRHATVFGLGVLLAIGSSRPVRAQGHTPDPYNGVGEYNVNYLDYLYPMYPNGYGVTPNQSILSGRSGVSQANQFQTYLDSEL